MTVDVLRSWNKLKSRKLGPWYSKSHSHCFIELMFYSGDHLAADFTNMTQQFIACNCNAKLSGVLSLASDFFFNFPHFEWSLVCWSSPTRNILEQPTLSSETEKVVFHRVTVHFCSNMSKVLFSKLSLALFKTRSPLHNVKKWEKQLTL